MISGAVAKRYARAIYDLSCTEAATSEIGAALFEIGTAVASQSAGAMASGVLSREQRSALVGSLAGDAQPGSTLAKFLGVLGDADRLEELPRIYEWFQQFEDEAAGRVRATIRSATALQENEIEAIRTKFSAIAGREVIATVEVDAGLIGGATVEMEGRVYDGSVSTSLARLESRMAGDA